MDKVSIVIPHPTVSDGDSFTAKFYFRDQASGVASAPDTIHWRVDCLTNCQVVQDWTALTAGESYSLTIASAVNALINSFNQNETRQITVVGNKDGVYQSSAVRRWTVKNRNLVP